MYLRARHNTKRQRKINLGGICRSPFGHYGMQQRKGLPRFSECAKLNGSLSQLQSTSCCCKQEAANLQCGNNLEEKTRNEVGTVSTGTGAASLRAKVWPKFWPVSQTGFARQASVWAGGEKMGRKEPGPKNKGGPEKIYRKCTSLGTSPGFQASAAPPQ